MAADVAAYYSLINLRGCRQTANRAGVRHPAADCDLDFSMNLESLIEWVQRNWEPISVEVIGASIFGGASCDCSSLSARCVALPWKCVVAIPIFIWRATQAAGTVAKIHPGYISRFQVALGVRCRQYAAEHRCYCPCDFEITDFFGNNWSDAWTVANRKCPRMSLAAAAARQ